MAAEQNAAKAKAEETERERQKKLDEERSRREAVKRAAQEEQSRIAADRRKRQQEEKEREEEAAKKKREREEKARKEREAREKEAKDKERREKEERAAKDKAAKEMVEREKAESAETERLAKESRDKAEREWLAKLEEERNEKARLEDLARKDREASEQARLLAAQQAQLERALSEKAAADRAAQDKIRPFAPVPPRARTTPRNGPTPHTTPPLEPSPVTASSSAIRPPIVRPQKTPQPFFPQPMPTAVSYPTRIPQQSFVPGLRPAFPSHSPVFSPPQINGSSSISPNPPTRGFQPEPSPPFEIAQRTAPIGMGFPPVKSARMPSVDEGFLPSTASTGAQQRSISGELIDDFRRDPAAIGPPGPIGRPASFLDQPISSTSTARSNSPAPPEQVFGSAALGADDEIVQPARRNASNGWDVPVAAAPGAGRWSASPSIWGNASTSDGAGGSWAGSGAPTRQPSFGALSVSGIGAPFSTPIQGGFSGLFSPSGQQPPPQQHHSHH